MYSSAFNYDARNLWRRRDDYIPRVHEIHGAQSQQHHQNHTQTPNFGGLNGSGASHAHNSHSLRSFRGQSRLQLPQIEPDHFAPPLSAYLTEECGASAVYTEYNTAQQLAMVLATNDVPLLTPGLLRRLQALRDIRSTGYTTLMPIGVGKTMAQIDAEAHIEEEESHCVQENSVHHTAAETLNVLANTSNFGGTGNSGSSRAERGTEHVLNMSRDLDDDVEDADNSDSYDEDLSDHMGSVADDGFMAQEVEYQNDHSLGTGTLTRFLTLPMADTPMTAVSGAVLACDEDMDMALEE